LTPKTHRGLARSAEPPARRNCCGGEARKAFRGCPATTLLHSEHPAAPHHRRHHGWVAQLAEQWTENPMQRVGSEWFSRNKCEQPRPKPTISDADNVNLASTDLPACAPSRARGFRQMGG